MGPSFWASSGNYFILHWYLTSDNFLKDRAIWNLKHINGLFVIFYIKIHWFILHLGQTFYHAGFCHTRHGSPRKLDQFTEVCRSSKWKHFIHIITHHFASEKLHYTLVREWEWNRWRMFEYCYKNSFHLAEHLSPVPSVFQVLRVRTADWADLLSSTDHSHRPGLPSCPWLMQV